MSKLLGDNGDSASEFSAGRQALGYLYQARCSLLLILNAREEFEISIETLDDIILESGDSPIELLQLKHHTVPANLTDCSPDLWRTLRVWSNYLSSNKLKLPGTILTLITTATSPDNSAASLLRPDNCRDECEALAKLLYAARNSVNKNLGKAFNSFLNLDSQKRKLLLSAIQVLDKSPNIGDMSELILEKLKLAVRKENRQGLYERLEGWWFGKVVGLLSAANNETITGFEVNDRIRSIAEQFQPEALPIDFLNATPPRESDLFDDERQFVIQLRIISVGKQRIEKAILDYYRAFEQRSRWAREDLLFVDELESYENKLIDEWERFTLTITEDYDLKGLPEGFLKNLGKQVFNWTQQVADIRIRKEVSEPYVMRGSYHMLADSIDPRVWWHPLFMDRVQEILLTKGG